MVFNPVDHKSNKHVRIGCHYTRELTENKIIAPIRVPTDANIADLFTKALPGNTFKKFANCIVGSTARAAVVTAKVMMFSHADNTTDAAQNSDSDSPATDEGPHSTPPSTFQRDWPYATIVKRELNADGFDALETDDSFSSGRKKFQINFYTKPVLAGSRIVISRHVGMKLVSRNGAVYYVCQRNPIDTGPHLPTPYEPMAMQLPRSTIAVAPPRFCLMCVKCGVNNTLQHARLSCLACAGSDFVWSCACSVYTPPFATETSPFATETKQVPPSPEVPISTTPVKITRSRRNPSQKSWTERVKYIGPLSRTTVYHRLQCSRVPEGSATVTTVEFANVYQLKCAPCCADGHFFATPKRAVLS
jgi:hypothetical protein